MFDSRHLFAVRKVVPRLPRISEQVHEGRCRSCPPNGWGVTHVEFSRSSSSIPLRVHRKAQNGLARHFLCTGQRHRHCLEARPRSLGHGESRVSRPLSKRPSLALLRGLGRYPRVRVCSPMDTLGVQAMPSSGACNAADPCRGRWGQRVVPFRQRKISIAQTWTASDPTLVEPRVPFESEHTELCYSQLLRLRLGLRATRGSAPSDGVAGSRGEKEKSAWGSDKRRP